MNTQAQQVEALRIAERLTLQLCMRNNGEIESAVGDAIKELRRQHARIAELEEINTQLCEQSDVAANAYAELQAHMADLKEMADYAQAQLVKEAAQVAEERDVAFEAVRKAFCKLQRYSFFLDSRGNVRRCADHCGNWVEFEQVHTMFEPQAVDAALAAQTLQKD